MGGIQDLCGRAPDRVESAVCLKEADDHPAELIWLFQKTRRQASLSTTRREPRMPAAIP